MNLVRLIVIALAVWLAIHTLRRHLNRPAPSNKSGSPENMVRCAQCGLHLPQAEAIAQQGRYYCSEEHRRLHSRPS